MSKGFTLIEMVIAIAIVGILASIAMPSFTDLIASTQVKTDASNLQMSLLRARSEAVKRNTNISIDPVGGDWKSGWEISDGIESQGPVKADISGPSNIVYKANGRVTGGSVNFDISSPDTTTERCVTISLSGQPRVKKQGC